jgi:hypothetical protein
MTQPPTRQEILEKYRDVIDAADFEVLATRELPPPAQLQQEGAWLEYLGPLKGAFLYLKRSLCRSVVVIAVFGGFMQGLEYIDKYSRLGYEKAQQVVQLSFQHCNQPATKYVIAVRDPATWDSHVPFQLPSDDLPLAASTTTTTTTTPSPSPPYYDLPPGSGFVPYSDNWPHLS